jgi:hypothetical protein
MESVGTAVKGDTISMNANSKTIASEMISFEHLVR